MYLLCHVSARMCHGHMWVSRDSFQKLVLFSHLDSGIRIQGGSLGDKCHMPLPAESSPVPNNNIKVRERHSGRAEEEF